MSWDPTQRAQPGGEQGQDPYSGYGGQQNPYGASQPNSGSYDPSAQQQNPYGTPPPGYNPPPQNPYANPGGYQQGGTYGYAAPQPQPVAARPVDQSIKELPNQYMNVITHPSDATFAAEMPKADWAMVWIQLGILIVVGVVIGLITGLIGSATIGAVTGSSSLSGSLAGLTVATSAGSAFLRIIFIPLFFFIGVGIQFVIAKAFNGQGTFLQQSYTQLLYKVPTDIIGYVVTALFGFIPVAGFFLTGIFSLALFIYEVVLNIFQIKATHRLTTGKAAAVVLIPYAVILVLGLLCAIVAASFILSILHAAAGGQ
ncbi:MAG TPA: Yip1 family protein [Ktedonobacteraceae bacterium]|nr:Yip1 family protein [Ktedonobacteraceae bacterium]